MRNIGPGAEAHAAETGAEAEEALLLEAVHRSKRAPPGSLERHGVTSRIRLQERRRPKSATPVRPSSAGVNL